MNHQLQLSFLPISPLFSSSPPLFSISKQFLTNFSALGERRSRGGGGGGEKGDGIRDRTSPLFVEFE